MEEAFELQELFQIFKKHTWLIIVLVLVGGLISGLFTHFFVTPTYQASTQLVLVPRGNEETPLTQGEISANLQMINTFNEVIVSPLVLDQVIEILALQSTASELRSSMNARNSSNSQVITLTVLNSDPELARDIANASVEIFKEEILYNFNLDNLMILAPALTPHFPISPRLTVNISIGFVAGIMIAIFLVFLLEFVDKTVKTEQEVEKLIGIPVIGVITLMEEVAISNKKMIKRRGKEEIQSDIQEKREKFTTPKKNTNYRKKT